MDILDKKVKVKVKFEITLKGINGLDPLHNGKNVFVEWKRGSKKNNKGTTPKVLVRDKSVIIEETISCESTMVQNVKKKTFDSKKIELELKEFLGPKKTEKIGESVIDLARFAAAGTQSYLSVPFKPKKQEKDAAVPTLQFNVTSTWTRYGGKILEKGKGADGSSMEIDGEQYNLKTDVDGGSDDDTSANLDTASAKGASGSSKSEKDDLASQMSDIKESDPPEKQNKKMRKLLKKLESENKKLVAENKSLKEKSKDRLKTVEAQKKEIATLKKHAPKEVLANLKKESEKDKKDEKRKSSSGIAREGIDEEDEDAADTYEQLISSIHKEFKSVRADVDTLSHWLCFTCTLFETLEKHCTDLSIKSEIPQRGIQLKQKEAEDFPLGRMLHQLEGVIFEIYTTLLKAIYAKLDGTLITYILEGKACILGTNINDVTRIPKEKNLNFTASLNDCYTALKGNHAFNSVLRQFFAQIFYYTNAKLLNYLFKRRDLNTCGTGFQLKFGVSMIEDWVMSLPTPSKDLLSPCLEQLQPCREAANLLVIEKSLFNDDAMFKKLFTVLNPFQVKQIMELFTPDQYYKETVPAAVVKKVDALCKAVPEQARIELDLTKLIAYG